MTSPVCPHCHVPMTPGFVPQFVGAAARVNRWCEGEPKNTLLSALVGGDVPHGRAEQGTPVTTFRCPKCFILQSYALPQP
jgi:hypothetical protein